MNPGGSIVPHDPFFCREAASYGNVTVSVVAAHGVIGAMRRAGIVVQSWVKPEVDPPKVCALPRGVAGLIVFDDPIGFGQEELPLVFEHIQLGVEAEV